MIIKKTRIFVTNSLNFLPDSDEIFVVENGSIIESGSYEALIKKNGAFSDFMKTFLESKTTDSGDYESIESNQQLNVATKVKSAKTNDEQIIQKEKIESGLVKFLNFLFLFNLLK